MQLMLERMKPWILLFSVMERGQEEDFSLYGMVSDIHVNTGKVMVYEMKSKVRLKCRAKKDLHPSSQQHIEWMESHAPKCSANFNKSSKAMESQGGGYMG